MNYTPYEKMSKKAKKEYNSKKRNTWAINPVTRTTPNPKAYRRAFEKASLRKEAWV